MAAEQDSDEDLNPQGSRSSVKSDDSDYMGDTECETPPCKLSNQHCSILASTTLSRAQQITCENLPSGVPPFTFLHHEGYACSCHTPSSHETKWTVLGFFQLSFFQSWNAIFCPLHNCIIPASKLESHLRKAHLVFVTGNPRVFLGPPAPTRVKPVPVLTGMGTTHIYPWVVTSHHNFTTTTTTTFALCLLLLSPVSLNFPVI
jgi:hypothetical protein